VLLVPVSQIASVVADGEVLKVTTTRNERYTIAYRVKDLERRLDPARFIRLARGTLANVDQIARVSAMPGGTYRATLSNGQQLQVSRIRARVLRERLLRI
jgi:two-component system LytT family response regulator